jgi:hypothetical protein
MRFGLSRLLTVRPPPPRPSLVRYTPRLRQYCAMSAAEPPNPAPHPVHSAAQPAPPAPGPNVKKEKKAKPADTEPKAPLEVCFYPFTQLSPTHLAAGCVLQINPRPDFFDHRIQIYDKLKKEYDEFVAGAYTHLYHIQPLNQLDSPTTGANHHHTSRRQHP